MCAPDLVKQLLCESTSCVRHTSSSIVNQVLYLPFSVQVVILYLMQKSRFVDLCCHEIFQTAAKEQLSFWLPINKLPESNIPSLDLFHHPTKCGKRVSNTAANTITKFGIRDPSLATRKKNARNGGGKYNCIIG